VSLEEIKEIITSPGYDAELALREHRMRLLEKREQLEALIANVERALTEREGGDKMSDKQKFEGFKQALIDDNEKRYGEEIREKYGRETIDKANRKIKGMTEEQYAQVEQLGADILTTLAEAFATGDPGSELAQKVAEMHRQWLTFYWDSYSKEAHAGVAQMYVDDPRFTAYYDKEQPGLAQFLRDAVMIYTGNENG